MKIIIGDDYKGLRSCLKFFFKVGSRILKKTDGLINISPSLGTNRNNNWSNIGSPKFINRSIWKVSGSEIVPWPHDHQWTSNKDQQLRLSIFQIEERMCTFVNTVLLTRTHSLPNRVPQLSISTWIICQYLSLTCILFRCENVKYQNLQFVMLIGLFSIQINLFFISNRYDGWWVYSKWDYIFYSVFMMTNANTTARSAVLEIM